MTPIVDEKKKKKETEEIGEEEEEKEEEEEEEQSNDRNMKIFFDFECRQERPVGESDLGVIYGHDANLCVAFKVCDSCKEKDRRQEFGSCEFCGQHIFKGKDC